MDGQFENELKVDINQNLNIRREMALINAMKDLSDFEQKVIVLRILKGYSIADTSIMLEKSAEAVKSIQFKAISKLARVIQKA